MFSGGIGITHAKFYRTNCVYIDLIHTDTDTDTELVISFVHAWPDTMRIKCYPTRIIGFCIICGDLCFSSCAYFHRRMNGSFGGILSEPHSVE